MLLNFPTYNFKVKRQENANYVFDIIRKKWVQLTPEEWVRQHVLHYLIHDKSFPAGLIAVERMIRYNGLTKRFDVCVFDTNGNAMLLIECKSADIVPGSDTLQQVAVYNTRFGCKHLLVTNGLIHLHVFRDDMDQVHIEQRIPGFAELSGNP